MTDHAKRIWLRAIAVVAKARNKCAPGERFEALNLVMGDLEDAWRRDQLIMPDFPAVCPDCGQHCEAHNGESDCATLQSGKAQGAEPVWWLCEDQTFVGEYHFERRAERAAQREAEGDWTVTPLYATPPAAQFLSTEDGEFNGNVTDEPAAQVTVADTIAALKAMPTRTEVLGGQDFKYIQLGEALDTLRALAGAGHHSRTGRRRQMKALIIGGPNRGQVVDMSNVVHTDSQYFGCKFGDKEFHFIVGADVPNPHEYVMRELCRAYEYLMKGETHRQHIKKNGKL